MGICTLGYFGRHSALIFFLTFGHFCHGQVMICILELDGRFSISTFNIMFSCFSFPLPRLRSAPASMPLKIEQKREKDLRLA